MVDFPPSDGVFGFGMAIPSRQIPLFDASGFTDRSAKRDRHGIRLGPSGRPWIGPEEISAAAESLREMVGLLNREIDELNLEYLRLARGHLIRAEASTSLREDGGAEGSCLSGSA